MCFRNTLASGLGLLSVKTDPHIYFQNSALTLPHGPLAVRAQLTAGICNETTVAEEMRWGILSMYFLKRFFFNVSVHHS